MVDGGEISRLQDAWVMRWHEDAVAEPAEEGWRALALGNHRANFALWHEEDKARDPGASDGEIAAVKRAIDRWNQERNDLMEQLDAQLLTEAPEQRLGAPLHSETPGMMIDRMSILALKIFHTREQAERTEAGAEHRARNAARLAVLEAQRADLAGCLGQLWSEVLAGTRRFHLYRQMKMYNDPELNPAIYGAGRRSVGLRRQY